MSCLLHGKVRVLDVRVDEAGTDEGVQDGLVVLVRFEVVELLEDRNVEAQDVVTDDGLCVCQEREPCGNLGRSMAGHHLTGVWVQDDETVEPCHGIQEPIRLDVEDAGLKTRRRL